MAKGRKAEWVEVAGEAVEGLYYDKGLNTYYFYIVDDRGLKRKVTRRKKATAALELYNYKLSNEQVLKETRVAYKDAKIDNRSKGNTAVRLVLKGSSHSDQYKVARIPESYIIEQFVELLDKNPRGVIETFRKMGRDELTPIIELAKNYKSNRIKLDDMLDWYLTIAERTTDTIRHSKQFFNHFCTIVNVKYVDQITIDNIKEYKTTLEKLKTDNDYSKAWLQHRYQTVKTIFRNAKLHVEQKDELDRVIDNMKLLKAIGKNTKIAPTPISAEDFQMFLQNVTMQFNYAKDRTKKMRYAKWKAILLTAANTCSHFKDIVNMKFSNKTSELGLDLKAGTLAMYREKSGTAKVCVLWGETVEAIKQFREILDVDSEYVFATARNNKNTASHLRDEFWRYIRPQTLALDPHMSKKIEFNQIRDACFTACANERLPLEQRNYISGHKNTGDDDSYLLRTPELAEPASDACYKYFLENTNEKI